MITVQSSRFAVHGVGLSLVGWLEGELNRCVGSGIDLLAQLLDLPLEQFVFRHFSLEETGGYFCFLFKAMRGEKI